MSRIQDLRVERWLLMGVWIGLLSAGRIGQAAGTWEVLTRPDAVDQVREPAALAVDHAGNLYVGDMVNQRVQLRTPQGVWSVIASTGAALGQVREPVSLAVDGADNLYVGDGGDNYMGAVSHRRITKRTPQGVWSVIATQGNGPDQVIYPKSLAVDHAGNLFVGDTGLSRPAQVVMRTPQGAWRVIASQGADFPQGISPRQLALDSADNLYVLDSISQSVRMRTPQGIWSLIAPGDTVTDPNRDLVSLATDASNNLYVGEGQSDKPEVWMRTTEGKWTIIAATGTVSGLVRHPVSLAADGSGNLYVGDDYLQNVQRRSTAEGGWSVIASAGAAPDQVGIPIDLATDRSGNLFVADAGNPTGGNARVQMRNAQGNWSVIASHGTGLDQVTYPTSLTLDESGTLYVNDLGAHERMLMRTPGGVWSVLAPPGPPFEAVSDLYLLAVDRWGNLFAEWYTGKFNETRNKYLLLRTPQGIWSVIATYGTAPDQIVYPLYAVVDDSGTLFVADWGDSSNGSDNNCRVLMRTAQGDWSVVASADSAPNQVRHGINLSIDGLGNFYVEDQGWESHIDRLMRRTPQGIWSVIASTSDVSNELYGLDTLTVNSTGTLFVFNSVWAEDYDPLTFQGKMRTPNGVWSVISSIDTPLYQIENPNTLTTDATGNLYVGDWGKHRILQYHPDSTFLYGDFDLDGKLTVADVVRSLSLAVSLTPSSPELVQRGDVSPRHSDGTFGDGALSIDDVVRLLRRVVGLEADPWP